MAKQDNIHNAEFVADPRAGKSPPSRLKDSAAPLSSYHPTVAQRTDMSGDLRAPGWLAMHPALGLILLLLGGLVFGILGYELRTNGPMVQWDTQLAALLHSLAVKMPGQINEYLTFGFFLGKEDLQILGAILMVYFLHKRFWPELGMVVIGWGGGSVIWNWLVYYFNRMRPEQQLGIEVRTIPSFPSGHTMFATLALGLLAYLLVPKMPSLFWKWVIVLASLVTVLFVGFSRVFQGGHYLSDALAGYAIGLAWGGLVYTVLELFVVRRDSQTGK